MKEKEQAALFDDFLLVRPYARTVTLENAPVPPFDSNGAVGMIW